MAKTLSTYTIVRNGIEFQYPFLECARSCLGVAEQVVFVVGVDGDGDDDGTLQALTDLQDEVGDKLRLIVKFWTPPHKAVFAEFKEAGRRACTGNWNIRIDADEVIHEKDYHIIRALIRANVRAYRFPQIRFYRDYFTEITSEADAGGYMYLYNADHVRFTGIRHEFQEVNLDGLVYPDTKHQFDTGSVIPQVRVFHYWGVKDKEVMGRKCDEIELQMKGGDWETRENYEWEFEDRMREWSGDHPAVMEERIKEWMSRNR